jgi:hypothetical protein
MKREEIYIKEYPKPFVLFFNLFQVVGIQESCLINGTNKDMEAEKQLNAHM